jgi:hypothetical protein
MKINVKDPETSVILEHEAFESENDKESGWSILLPAGNSIFITSQQGEWKIRNDGTVNLNLVNAMGEAIEVCLAQQKKAGLFQTVPKKL